MKAPICPECNNKCSPSGGIVGEGSKTIYWTCWGCNYKIEDVDYKEETNILSLSQEKNSL